MKIDKDIRKQAKIQMINLKDKFLGELYWDMNNQEIVTYVMLQDRFHEFMNDGDDVIIFGLTYLPGDVLRAVDPIAYHQEFLAYVSNEQEDGNIEEIEV